MEQKGVEAMKYINPQLERLYAAETWLKKFSGDDATIQVRNVVLTLQKLVEEDRERELSRSIEIKIERDMLVVSEYGLSKLRDELEQMIADGEDEAESLADYVADLNVALELFKIVIESKYAEEGNE